MRTCWTTNLCWDITLRQRKRRKKNSFEVQYGFVINTDLTYEQAAAKLGQCIMHALACENKLDNERD